MLDWRYINWLLKGSQSNDLEKKYEWTRVNTFSFAGLFFIFNTK